MKVDVEVQGSADEIRLDESAAQDLDDREIIERAVDRSAERHGAGALRVYPQNGMERRRREGSVPFETDPVRGGSAL